MLDISGGLGGLEAAARVTSLELSTGADGAPSATLESLESPVCPREDALNAQAFATPSSDVPVWPACCSLDGVRAGTSRSTHTELVPTCIPNGGARSCRLTGRENGTAMETPGGFGARWSTCCTLDAVGRVGNPVCSIVGNPVCSAQAGPKELPSWEIADNL